MKEELELWKKDRNTSVCDAVDAARDRFIDFLGSVGVLQSRP